MFDNDGTLWTEKPMPTQLHYRACRWMAAAEADPSLAEKQPYKAAVTGDFAWLGGAIDKHYAGDDSDLKVMIGAILGVDRRSRASTSTRRGVRVLPRRQAPDPRPAVLDAVYQPMVELLRYLEANDFTCYIVSGGDRDFMRPMTPDNYGIPPERVIGSAPGLRTTTESGDVRYGSQLLVHGRRAGEADADLDADRRRPILAGGNSNGDIPMLRFVQRHPRSLSLLVHHDDDSGRGDTPYDKGAEEALAAAGQRASRWSA